RRVAIGLARRQPGGEDGYRAGASCFTVEECFDLLFAHTIEISGYHELSGHEAEPARFMGRGRLERDHLDHGLAVPAEDEGLALRRLLEQPRQMRLRFMDVDGVHARAPT